MFGVLSGKREMVGKAGGGDEAVAKSRLTVAKDFGSNLAN